MIPIGEFYRIVEPADVHPWKSAFEPGECRSIPRQHIQTDKRQTPHIARKPFRPDRKHAVGFDEALDEVVKGRPDWERCAARWRHVPIHNDYSARRQPGREIGNQRTRRTMTHHNCFMAAGHVLKELSVPCASGRRRRMMGQDVRHLDITSRRPQAFGRWLPARRPDQRSCHKSEMQGHGFPKSGRQRRRPDGAQRNPGEVSPADG